MATQTEFTQWWPQAEQGVRALGARLGFGRVDVDDLAQDVAYAALMHAEHGGLFRDADHLTAWSRKAASWLVVDQARFLKRAAKARGVLGRLLGGRSPSADPSATASSSELTAMIMRAAQHLPDRQRSVVLAELRGEADESVAERLRIEVSTVRSLRRHAKLRIAERLEEQVDGELNG